MFLAISLQIVAIEHVTYISLGRVKQFLQFCDRRNDGGSMSDVPSRTLLYGRRSSFNHSVVRIFHSKIAMSAIFF